MENKKRKGFVFTSYEEPDQSPFEKLFEIFKELITHTSGDFDEAIDWLRELDQEYQLTDDNYTIEDFIEDLKRKGYIRQELDPNGDGQSGDQANYSITSKTEQLLRKHALEQIFGKLKKSGSGNHRSKHIGQG